jgi:hypothetical protein
MMARFWDWIIAHPNEAAALVLAAFVLGWLLGGILPGRGLCLKSNIIRHNARIDARR